MIWIIIGVSGFILLSFSVLSEYMFYDSRMEEYNRVQKEISFGHLAGFKHYQEVVVPLLITSMEAQWEFAKKKQTMEDK